ncbi:hypothetical protein AVEN_7610-1 [Araneus ventricosus]|uniref:Uncharacterized protein n=1 Tax=Araneus ventricosus TaxID=182803 RepID=A0A4Y2N2E8_ARAVE|nr:hypothetical protein AVEN_7610-1 [Araneus ventricosus]
MAVLPPLEKTVLQSRESDANAEMSSSSASEEDALEYDMSEDLEDSPAVISPPPSSKPEKSNKYKNSKLPPRVGRAWRPIRRVVHFGPRCINRLVSQSHSWSAQWDQAKVANFWGLALRVVNVPGSGPERIGPG